MTILVTGATGSVGRPLVHALLDQGVEVRALTRDPSAAGLPAGVEVARADLADPGSLTPELFAGVDRAFVFPAQNVEPFAAAAVAAGVERFVVLSSLAAAREFARDEGSASQLHHAAVESAITRRTSAWTILRPGTFANNLLSWAWPISMGAPIRVPYLDSAQAPIHEADVADAIAAALLDDGTIGQAIPITGPQSLTRREQVGAIAAGIGRELEVVEISPDEFRADVAQFVPEPIIAMLLDYWRDTVAEPDRVRSVEALTGAPGRTLQSWARDHRSEFGAA
ncbi:MAG: NAD(P)H-binding protein [Microbacterium sp.]|uniref:SDR family oxidoreductase n=1 Tax=Microbacterium sp. TaxID=51671 RepID=UPI0039E2B7F5